MHGRAVGQITTSRRQSLLLEEENVIHLVSRRDFARLMASAASAAGMTMAMPSHGRAEGAPTLIGVSIPTLNNPFWVRAVEFANHAAKELNLELVVVGAENREDKQLADVQSLLARGVKALVVTPQSTSSAPGLIRLANRANVPLVIVDRFPGFPANDPRASYVAFLGPNDVTAGRDIANYLISHGATKLIGLGGPPGSSVAEGREKGLREAVAAAPNAKLVQYIGCQGESEDNGYSAMQNMLSAHPKGTISGVWAYNDALALGAFRAIRQAGREDEIKIGGMDLNPQAIDLISRNTNYVFSTGGHWLEIGFGVMIAYDKLRGHNPIKTDIRLDLLGVDKENVEKAKAEFFNAVPPYDVKQYTLTNNPSATSQTFPLQLK